MEQLTVNSHHIPVLESTGEILFREQAMMRQYPRHSLIYSPGERASAIYMVGHGEVKLSRYTPDGRELTLDHIGPSSIFGEMEILLDRSRESQALARTECVIYQMDKNSLMKVIGSNPQFGLWLSKVMSQRQSRMEDRLETLLFKSANGKVAQILLKLAGQYGEQLSEGTLINYPITHQEIGNLIATTRETVSYAFMEFRQRGLISTRQRKTIVHDLGELEAVALN